VCSGLALIWEVVIAWEYVLPFLAAKHSNLQKLCLSEYLKIKYE
jgi:hypothetical protein